MSVIAGGGNIIATGSFVGATSGGGFPNGIPSFATAFGFNKLGFLDHFASTSTIDLNNTTANGFNWYLTFPHRSLGQVGPPSDPSWFSAANSILTVSSSVAGAAQGF